MSTSHLLRICLIVFTVLICSGLLPGCGDDDDDQSAGDDDTGDDDTGDDDTGDGGTYYDPSWIISTDLLDPIRDRRYIRSIIHAHSIYSHDACDNNPVGNIPCLMALRSSLCRTRQDVFILTDHSDSFAENEFPDVLLYLPKEGDRLFEDEQGFAFANKMTCPDGNEVTIFAGGENDIMPVHLHRHPEGSIEDRYHLYDSGDAAAAQAMRDLGASVLVNHSEQWSVEELLELQPDGIEVFNLHTAIHPGLRPDLGASGWTVIFDILLYMLDPGMPHPNLAMMAFWPGDEAYMERWNGMLAKQKCSGVLGTDVHRNSLPFPLSDGERADGYRRMMQFFSNFILVDDESPEAIEEAQSLGRHIGVFEYLGFPKGFDFYLTDGDNFYEMGEEVVYSPDLQAVISRPEAFMIDPEGPQPEITTRLVRVIPNGEAKPIDEQGDLTVDIPGPGAYRAEILITPHHLTEFLGDHPERYMHQYPWIYANPIYVTGPAE